MRRAVTTAAVGAFMALAAFAPPGWWLTAHASGDLPIPSPTRADTRDRPVCEHQRYWASIGWTYETGHGGLWVFTSDAGIATSSDWLLPKCGPEGYL